MENLSWESYFKLAKDFYHQYGNLNIHQDYSVKIDDDIVNLGLWLHNQRQFYKKRRLSAEKIRMLESIGMKWSDKVSLNWESYFELARNYYNQKGNLKIPSKFTIKLGNSENVINLGMWIHNQRQFYKNGKLSKERVKLLDSIGMVWDVNLSKWEDYYELACAFYQHHGHLNIPQGCVVMLGNDTFKLGSWINNQRDEYKNGRLSENRIKLLESIKIRWSIKPFLWEDNYKLAKAYYEHYGNLEVPRSFNTKNGYDFDSSEDSIRLGKWINTQRIKYKNRELSEERIKLLESIGMEWSPRFSIWEFHFKLAVDYYKQHGNLDMPQNYSIKIGEEVIDLGLWLHNQRHFYKNYNLSKEKIKLLESIGMKWTQISFLWEDKFEIAKAYYEHYGNLDVPIGFSTINGYDFDDGDDSVKLGNWINAQRSNYKNGKLSEEKIKLLEGIGMKWSLQTLAWEKYYNLAKLYYEQNGNLNVPQNYVIKNDNDNINLGIWISTQRKTYKRGQLSNEKKEMLESIGMIWQIRKRKPKEDNKSLCEEYGLDCEKYPDLLKIPYEVLSAKINYLNSNNVSLMNNNVLNPIFFMSDVNMQVMYGISLEDLVKQYSNSSKKGGK